MLRGPGILVQGEAWDRGATLVRLPAGHYFFEREGRRIYEFDLAAGEDKDLGHLRIHVP
jgi:hypothetical protein